MGRSCRVARREAVSGNEGAEAFMIASSSRVERLGGWKEEDSKRSG